MEIVYNSDQFLLLISVILISVFAYLGESSDKKDHLRRGIYFMFVWILSMFTGLYFTQIYEWYISFTLISISGFYALRGFINFGMVKKFST